jgi:MoaA/NifB/PqqE/SkfB family radical SAM enzyme
LKETKLLEDYFKVGRLYRDEGKFDLSIKEFKKALGLIEEDLYLKNKILNEIEISQRKTILESKPRGLAISLTTRCNLRCKMCKVWRSNKDFPKERAKEIISLLPYLQFIIWQGGETFLVDYFEELFDEASKYRHLKQQIITNGLLIDEKWARKLAREKLELVFSIDSVIKKTYENIRRGANFYDLIERINLINLYKKKINEGLPESSRMLTTINFVVMKSNYHELVLFPNFAKKFGFDRIVLMPIEGLTDEENIFIHKDPLIEDNLREAMFVFLQKAKEYKIAVLSWLPLNLYIQRNNNNSARSPSRRAGLLCYWPWQFMMIDDKFKARPHCLCQKRVGDMNVDSFEEVWNGEMMQLYRKKIIDNDYEGLCDSRCTSGVVLTEHFRLN